MSDRLTHQARRGDVLEGWGLGTALSPPFARTTMSSMPRSFTGPVRTRARVALSAPAGAVKVSSTGRPGGVELRKGGLVGPPMRSAAGTVVEVAIRHGR